MPVTLRFKSRFPGTSYFLGGIALIAASSPALAGGLDLSGQDVSELFKPGNYAELSYGYVSPTVSGQVAGIPSGDMAPGYGVAGAAIKTDFGPNLSAALIVDQPWGASADYPAGTGYPMAGAQTHVDSTGVTLMGRYKVTGNFSIDGGLRYITVSGDLTLPAVSYATTYASDSDLGYVVGAAYERPDIALRAALTYSTATTYQLTGSPGTGDATAKMPKSVNFDFQSGVAPNTLLMGEIRWANWSAASVTDSMVGTLVSYNHDVVTYSLGLGHRFTPQLSTKIDLGYEPSSSGTVSDLQPYNGYTSLGIGASWTQNNIRISGGVRQYWLGSATTSTVGGYFSGDTALGAGLKVSFSF